MCRAKDLKEFQYKMTLNNSESIAKLIVINLCSFWNIKKKTFGHLLTDIVLNSISLSIKVVSEQHFQFIAAIIKRIIIDIFFFPSILSQSQGFHELASLMTCQE